MLVGKGKITPFQLLIASSTNPDDLCVVSCSELSSRGLEKLQFWDILTKLELVLNGATWDQRAVAWIWHMLFGVESLPTDLDLGNLGGFSPTVELEVVSEPTFSTTSTNCAELYEGSARQSPVEWWGSECDARCVSPRVGAGL